ncbi:MAG: endo alpha-1,4 polygalactosaminidase [Bacteroidales bacterium]|nr:endo alpha-1,4 polygalactosaminidase [Bacteroidales bacterium]
MKKYLSLLLSLLFIISCADDHDNSLNQDFKEDMRDFVIGISKYSKAINSKFLIIPQNGIELATINGEDYGMPHTNYLNAIDGNGQEDLFYGYDNDNDATPIEENTYLKTLLDISKTAGNTILVTDYCSTESKMDDSYTQNNMSGYVSFAADHRELNTIPTYPTTIYSENNKTLVTLADVENFLYLINPENYTTKQDFINAVTSTNYDLLIMDLFFNDNTEFTYSEINQLKNKENGGTRFVICYMSIGEAEDYRYYWDQDWIKNNVSWLDAENPDWEGNYKVKYWRPEWQSLIYGNNNSYLKKILDANFDGVYLDIIDAFEYYE